MWTFSNGSDILCDMNKLIDMVEVIAEHSIFPMLFAMPFFAPAYLLYANEGVGNSWISLMTAIAVFGLCFAVGFRFGLWATKRMFRG